MSRAADPPTSGLLHGGLPADWDAAWGDPSPFLRRQVAEIRREFERLAAPISHVDRTARYGALVGSADLRSSPIHRWYFYKEAFSPRLPALLRRDLNIVDPEVADVFGGVATTALALLGADGVERIRSIEFSPFAQFVGATKLAWPRLHPARLRRLLPVLTNYGIDYSLPYPALAAFDNPEIFSDAALASLVSAREHIRATEMRQIERDFFTLGLAAVIETASGVKKDGRALRILRGRSRANPSLSPRETIEKGKDAVRHLLTCHWVAMIEDLEDIGACRSHAHGTEAIHVRGDARDLGLVKRSPRRMLFDAGSVGWSCFSPPYLNCIDYTEVYKLELWLLEFVTSQHEFRELRLGTLRSHPSVMFPERAYLAGVSDDAADLIASVTDFVERHGMRPSEARMIPGYFDDMYRVLTQQMWLLKPGGWVSLVVGNSTFARRMTGADGRLELWRMPILTDVLLAHLARLAGFEQITVFAARHLRPRNVQAASARESIVVARKPAC